MYKKPISKLVSVSLSICALSTLTVSAHAQNTSQRAVRTLQAESANQQNGVTAERRFITDIGNGDSIRFDNVNLGAGLDSIVVRYTKTSSATAGFEVRVDDPNGPVIASVASLPTTPSQSTFRNRLTNVSSVSGSHTVYVRFTGPIDRVDLLRLGRAQRILFQAERANQQNGTVIEGRVVVSESAGNNFRFNNVRLGDGFGQLRVRYGKESGSAGLDIIVGDLSSAPVASISLPATGSFTTFRNAQTNIPISALTGRDDVYFVTTGDGNFDVDFVEFRNQPLQTERTAGQSSSSTGVTFFGVNDRFAAVTGDPAFLRYDNVSVSYNPRIFVRYARQSNLATSIEIRNGSATGTLYGTIDLPNTGSFDTYAEASTLLTRPAQGIRDLVFVVRGAGGVNIEAVRVERLGSDENETEILGDENLTNIVVDQFGYRPEMQKVAVIRDAEVGFGSELPDYAPGVEMQVQNVDTGEIVFTGNVEVRNGGAVEQTSGDRIWWFDFSDVDQAGSYTVFDPQNNARSGQFDIRDDVYEDVLRTAFRTFLYQRSGFAKSAALAGPWSDGASHLRFNQDPAARRITNLNAPTRDLRGGWYDAGDYNKYTNFNSDYILGLLNAYRDNPSVWGDDFDMPESGNGIPDIIDEVVFGLQHMIRMQNGNGSILSVVGVDIDDIGTLPSPPSSDTLPRFFGPPTTSASMSTAGAFALAATVLDSVGGQGLSNLSNDLRARAISAYDWAERNPNRVFQNEGVVAAGEQEVCAVILDGDVFIGAENREPVPVPPGSPENFCDTSYGQAALKRIASIYLCDLTGDDLYCDFIENDFMNANIVRQEFFVSNDETEEHSALLHYSTITTNTATSNTILSRFGLAIEMAFNSWQSVFVDEAPYRSFLADYTVGSNRAKAIKGLTFAQLNQYNISLNDVSPEEITNASTAYVNYLHGVNPFGLVFLSNMNEFGAENSVDQFYHSWFQDNTVFDSVSQSPIGPPPGFLVGGPFEGYGGLLQSIRNQPKLKVFEEFNTLNTNGDFNSFNVTENSLGYQIAYLRLLARYVDQN